MVFSFNLPNPTFESENPRAIAGAFNQDMLAKAIANQINATKSRFEEPRNVADLIQKHLENTHKELENKYYGPNIESEIGFRGAQSSHLGAETNKLNQMLPQELIAQQLQNKQRQIDLDPLMQSPETKTIYALQKSGIITPEKAKDLLTNIIQNNNKLTSFDRMPVLTKNASIAQGMAFGNSETQAYNDLRAGKTLEQMAQEAGFDPKRPETWPQKSYNPTTATVTRQQRSNVAQAGIEAIEPQITKSLAPYAKKWNGVSLLQLKQSLAGTNDEEIGKAIAAAAAGKELAALRLTSGGITPGINALRDTIQGAKLNLNTPDLALNPKQFEAAQNEIGRIIKTLNTAENEAAFGKKTAPKNLQEYEQKNPPEPGNIDYSDPKYKLDDLYRMRDERHAK